MGLNRSGHIQIVIVAVYANIRRIFEVAIGYAVEQYFIGGDGIRGGIRLRLRSEAVLRTATPHLRA